MSNLYYDLKLYEIDSAQASELMEKFEPYMVGYSRMVIVLACQRIIGAMLGPGTDESREDFLVRFPELMRSLWKAMDAEIPRK